MIDTLRRAAGRREFLIGTAAAAVAAPLWRLDFAVAQTVPRGEAIASWKKRIEDILEHGGLPIIDVEFTYVAGRTDIGWIIGQMKKLGVAQIVVATAAAPNSTRSRKLHEAHSKFIIPATNSGEFPRWWKGPTRFVDGLARDLDSRAYYMMGEHEFRHYPSPEQARVGRTDRDITIDIDGPAGHRLFRLSEESGLAFQIHYEIEDRLLPKLETMLKRYPKAKVIWCHLGMIRYPDRAKLYGPDFVASLIERFPNLHFDLASPPAGHVYMPSGAHDGTLYDSSTGKLKAEWRAVLEKHPQRFLAATDYRPPVEKNYPTAIRFQRKLLEQLDPSARRPIAFANAWRLITETAWT